MSLIHLIFKEYFTRANMSDWAVTWGRFFSSVNVTLMSLIINFRLFLEQKKRNKNGQINIDKSVYSSLLQTAVFVWN